MSMDVMRDGKPVPLRIVPPPTITGTPGENAPPGTTSKEGLLAPLTMREKALVCAVADGLAALRERAELGYYDGPEWDHMLTPAEKQGVLGLLVAFKDATGCAWTDACWT